MAQRRIRNTISRRHQEISINREDLAWVAGFFDGEGCVTTTERRYRKTIYINPRIIIGQACDLYILGEGFSTLLEKVQRIFPFKTIIRYERIPQKSSNLLMGNLTIQSCERVQAAMCMMWPWLGQPKKDQYIDVRKRLA